MPSPSANALKAKDDPGNKEELARLEAGAEEKYSKTNRGRQQITINGVTMYGRVRNAVKECRTNLDVNKKYTHADECIGNILKQHRE